MPPYCCNVNLRSVDIKLDVFLFTCDVLLTLSTFACCLDRQTGVNDEIGYRWGGGLKGAGAHVWRYVSDCN